MGYRTYIGTLSKKEYNKIKSMCREQLIKHYNKENEVEEDEYYFGMGVYDFGESLYEFGKYTDFEPPKKSTSTFFKNKELNKYFTEENDFCIVNPEFLEYLIEYYSQKVRNYYSEMLNPFIESVDEFGREKHKDFLNSIQTKYGYPNDKHTFDFSKITDEEQSALFKIIEHIRSMSQEWGINSFLDTNRPYRLKQNSNQVSKSCKYEYAIFELVNIYNTFDWKRNMMYFYGY